MLRQKRSERCRMQFSASLKRTFRCLFPFPRFCWLSRQTLQHFVSAHPVPVRTGNCSSSTTHAEEGREDNAKQRGKHCCSAAVFHPAHETVTLQATTKTDLLTALTAAGKLSHPAADTAGGSSLESKCFARVTQDLFSEGMFQVPVSYFYPQPPQQSDSLERADPAGTLLCAHL